MAGCYRTSVAWKIRRFDPAQVHQLQIKSAVQLFVIPSEARNLHSLTTNYQRPTTNPLTTDY